MTIGQRIAEKRKELGLSQEALGQELGVSRQSVYKWESDAALPEIDKLVALSRRFGVTVGWLLGVEEPAPAEAADSPDPEQLAERIALKYIEAQPKPSKGRRILFKIAIGAAALCFCFGMTSLLDKLEQMEERYGDLQWAVSDLRSDVSSQIGGITQRVEQAVKGQNQIAADYSAAVTATDIPGNTVTFAAMALPKEEPGDLAVLFTAEYEPGQLVTVPGTRQADGSWRADVTCPLTDSINLSVVFETGGTRKNQRLELFTGLYRDTFPTVDLQSHSMFIFKDLEGESLDVLTYVEEYTELRYGTVSPGEVVAAIQQVRVGFFKNHQLVRWLEPMDGVPPTWHGYDDSESDFYKLSKLQLKLTEQDIICLAAVVTDQYGREMVYPDMYYRMDTPDSRGRELTYASLDYTYRQGPWEY